MQIDKLKGTGVAIVTPFRTDNSVDFAALETHVERLIANQVDYLVVLGTTGESVTQSAQEKEAVVNHVIDINNKRVPIVIGIGGNNTQDVVNKIKATSFDGIEAILSVSPYYNKPSQKGLFDHYKSIAVASPVPIIVYNVPGRTSSNINAETTVELAKKVDNIVAVKEASGDIMQIMQIIKNKPDNFIVLSGDDPITLPLISIGVEGVISVTANAFPMEFSQMVRLALNGNFEEANEIHYRLLDITNSLFAEGNPAGIKAALNILGIIPNNLRSPLTRISAALYKRLENQIKDFK